MNALKEFMQHIRKVSYSDVYLILDRDVLPQLTEYVFLVEKVQFKDNFYENYYGEIKKPIACFLTFWKYVIDDVIQEADKCTNVIDREELLVLMDRTIDIHQSRQIDFGKTLLPVHSPVEKQVYEEMEELYNKYMEKLYELKVKIEKLDKREKVDDFAQSHFKITVKRTTELFEATHAFLSMMLADRIMQIRVSVEEIAQRMRNNLRDIQSESETTLVDLLRQLYEKNKELLQISRQDRKSSTEIAEARHGIDVIRSKIEKFSYDPPLSRLEEEVAYWDKRVSDFHQCADKLVKLKKEQEDVIKEEEIYSSMRTTELPGSKKHCWLSMGENFAQRKLYLNEKIIEAAKTLITFFAVRGSDRILYKDEVGPYYVDEYKHQVYVFDYGMNIYHMNCEGTFTKPSNNNLYFFDTFGRYILGENGSKVYQCAPCTSEYNVTTGNLLKKMTVDCGHSETLKQKCHVVCKDGIRPGEIVPDVPPIDIKSSLEPEVVRYLWDSFGHVLPQALHDVGTDRTRNPIQYLAHKILLHKYNKTKAEYAKKMKESAEYRANIFKDRKEKAMAASRAWKAKQVKRRKPEESDDRDERVARDVLAEGTSIADALNRSYD